MMTINLSSTFSPKNTPSTAASTSVPPSSAHTCYTPEIMPVLPDVDGAQKAAAPKATVRMLPMLREVEAEEVEVKEVGGLSDEDKARVLTLCGSVDGDARIVEQSRVWERMRQVGVRDEEEMGGHTRCGKEHVLWC